MREIQNLNNIQGVVAVKFRVATELREIQNLKNIQADVIKIQGYYENEWKSKSQ